jgi:polyferredoxin
MKRRARGEPARYNLIRPRTVLYAVAMALVGGVMLFQLTTHSHMGQNVRAPMFATMRDGGIRNGYTLRFLNKGNNTRRFAFEVSGIKDASLISEEADTLPDGRLVVRVDPDATQEIQLYVSAQLASLFGANEKAVMKATELASGESVAVKDKFFAQ